MTQYNRFKYVCTKEDYKRFEENLREKLKVNLDNIHTKQQLDVLLEKKGYYNVVSDKTPTYLIEKKTKNICDAAWRLLTEKQVITVKPVKVEVRPEKPKAKKRKKKKYKTSIRKIKRGKRTYHYYTKRSRIVKKLPKGYIKIKPKGFKKTQIRHPKTGKILGWI